MQFNPVLFTFTAFSFWFSAEHQNFLHLTYGENLKMKLYIDHSNVTIVYRLKSDNVDQIIVDRGVVVAPLNPLLEGRLIVEGSELIMKKVQVADMGVFKVTDLAGFPVAHIYIEVDGKINLQRKIKYLLLCFDGIFFFLDLKTNKLSLSFCLALLSAYKLPPLTVAILSMLGLIASMLLVCLLSCLYKVHKRNEKNKKLVLLAQQAGKGDGEAFREVTHTVQFLSNGLTFLRFFLKISINIEQRDWGFFLFLNTLHLNFAR